MRALLLLCIVLAAACGRKAESSSASANAAPAPIAATTSEIEPTRDVAPWPEGFPKPSVDYAGVFDFGAAGETIEVTVAASGMKQRMALPPGRAFGAGSGQWSQIMVNENNGAAMMMWPEGEGAPKIASTMSRNDVGAMASAFGVDQTAQARAKRTGSDKIAGESCAVYEVAAENENDAPVNACVTRDGIPLRLISGGQTVMLAKSIERGRQDPSLFSPPAGYEVVDMGECMRMSAEMMKSVQDGKMPDMSVMGPKMEKCRVIGEKMGAMFGAQ